MARSSRLPADGANSGTTAGTGPARRMRQDRCGRRMPAVPRPAADMVYRSLTVPGRPRARGCQPTRSNMSRFAWMLEMPVHIEQSYGSLARGAFAAFVIGTAMACALGKLGPVAAVAG